MSAQIPGAVVFPIGPFFTYANSDPSRPASVIACRNFVRPLIASGLVKIGADRILPREYARNLNMMPLYYGTKELVDAAELLRQDSPSLPRKMPESVESTKFIAFAEPGIRFPDGSVVRAMWLVAGLKSKEIPADYDIAFTLEDDGERGSQTTTRIGYYTSASYFHKGTDGGKAYKIAQLVDWIIDNPDLMEKTVVDTSPALSKAAKKRGKTHEPSPVTVVDLRAAHRKSRADVAEAERTYRHRWIVRGHWHRFWTGPRNGERKLDTRYVMEYVKGPAGAPLNVTTKVSKW